MLKKIMSLMLAVLMLLIFAVACTPKSPTETPQSGGGTLKVALTNPFTGAAAINTANPYRYSTLNQVYETLLAYENGAYVGVLAKEWDKIDDYTWKVTLFDGIKDSKGNSFTSSDVAFVLNAQKDAGHNLNTYYEKDSVKVVSDTVFELTLRTDSVGAFYLLGVQMFQCTKAAYEGSSDNLATMPVGTGPYVCTNYIEGSSATLEKRTDYWKNANLPKASVANFDVIEISYVPEATQMSMAIESGNVHFAGQVAMSIAPQVDTFKGVTPLYISNGTYNGFSFNMNGRPVSDNKALREAVCYAIDPNGLIASVYSGHAALMNTYGMPTASDFDATWKTNKSYDPDMAKQKLAEAGYANGVTLTLLSNNVGEDSQMAELVQGYLGAVGITLQMDYVEPATQNARRMEGNWDINFAGGQGVLDMYIFWDNLYGISGDTGMSRFFHNDPALYDVFTVFKAAGGKTTANLKALYEYEIDNVTWFPMFNKQTLYTFSDGYNNVYTNAAYQALPFLGTVS